MTSSSRARDAREARRLFEAVLDHAWNRRASLWLDTLLRLAEDDDA